MGGEVKIEQDVDDMDAKATAEQAGRNRGVVVGVKSAHFRGPGGSRSNAREAGTSQPIFR
jgi:hypothetical protein